MNIVIFGATSLMAFEAAKVWAKQGHSLLLIGRSAEKLDSIQQDLLVRARGTHIKSKILTEAADLDQQEMHEELVKKVFVHFTQVDVALLFQGYLGDQSKAHRSWPEAHHLFLTNFINPVSLLQQLSHQFAKQKSGTISVVTSVAGDRGRSSNMYYGSAKGGLSLYLQGLRAHHFRDHVRVLTIKPGFVDTPMTAHLKKGLLFASAETVGAQIVKSVQGSKEIIYLPWFWQWVMLIIKLLPEKVMKRLKI